jgi:hypothetical protein
MPLIQEATMGFEPMIRVLQTLALPLGYVADETISLQQSAISGIYPSDQSPG